MADTPGFEVPLLACDSHIHVFGDPARYPPAPKRLYTPTAAPLDAYRSVARGMGLQRVVLVQASAYGTDNSCMVDALRGDPVNTRGIAVIDEHTPEATLDDMQRAGVVGIRVGLTHVNITPETARATLRAASERVAPRGWHVQVLARTPMLEALIPVVAALPTPIVFDHMGWSDAARGPNQSGLNELVDLVAANGCWVKISGSTHVSRQESGFRDVLPIMRRLIAANAERLVWGTDWPHIKQQGLDPNRPPQTVSFLPIDNLDLLRLPAEAAQDDAKLHRILVDNPATLYGFR